MLNDVRETSARRHKPRSATLRGRTAVDPDPCPDCGSRSLVADSEGAWCVLCYGCEVDPVRETPGEDPTGQNPGLGDLGSGVPS